MGSIAVRQKWLLVAALLTAAAGWGSCAAQVPADVELQPVFRGLTQPLQIAVAPGDFRAVYVVEKIGRVWAFIDGRRSDLPLLDISESVSRGFEQGLLGIAFHPDYQQNGRLFINYTDTRGDTRIEAYTVEPASRRADPASRRTILHIPQPAGNHNGGMLAFGPDGYLYIGSGDGGRFFDPSGNGQNLGTLLGKILRIDVDAGEPYAVPPDNPFVGDGGALPEIWAYGLRNPWRFSFDRATGDLYIADVGERSWEEVNVQPAGSAGGENYGWSLAEGFACLESTSVCEAAPITPPIATYSHGSGRCSIAGGYVYRGSAIPGLVGRYVFGDYCTGTIWSVPAGTDGEGKTPEPLLESGGRISGFGEDHGGEIYVAVIDRGVVYKIVPAR